MQDHIQQNAASHITRILILSYFIALATGLIGGAEISRLATPFLPPDMAFYLTSGLVLALSILVVVGIFRRPAALILALIVFWSSYITLFANGDINGFWRDLALIGGLLISAGVGNGLSLAKRAEQAVPDATPSEPVPDLPRTQSPRPRATVSRFREDLSLARSG